MSMMQEIEKLMLDAGACVTYRIVNLSGNRLYVEGIKTVVSFGVDEMNFQLKNCLLTVKGEGLNIKYLDKTTCVLEGKINLVETK